MHFLLVLKFKTILDLYGAIIISKIVDKVQSSGLNTILAVDRSDTASFSNFAFSFVSWITTKYKTNY